MMKFDFEDFEDSLKSTRLVIDKLRTYVSERPACQDLDVSPCGSFQPGDCLIDMDYNVSHHKQRKRQAKALHGTKQNDVEHATTLTRANESTAPNLLKPTKKETKQSGEVIDGHDDKSYELNTSGYSIRVVNASWINKLNVARGLSESLREIFLTSPEKSSIDSTTAPLMDLSDIETSLETHSSCTDSSRTEYSENYGNDTSCSVDTEAHVCSTSVLSDLCPIATDMTSVLSLPSQGSVSERSDFTSNLDSSLYLNNNDSWSIYSTSDSDSNTSGGSAPDPDVSTGFHCDVGGTEPISANWETETINTEINYKIPSTDSVITGSNPLGAGECFETKDKSSAAYHEFQNDIDFLAKCRNKMSTPDKKSPIPSTEQKSYFKEPYLDQTNDTSSNVESNYSRSMQSDTGHTTDSSAYLSTTESSNSSHFVHGISPLCKMNEIKPTGQSHSAKFVRRRLIVVNTSLHDTSTTKSFSEKDVSPTCSTAIFGRYSQKVRRRIIFTHSLLQHDNNIDRASLAAPIRSIIECESKEAENSVSCEFNRNNTYDIKQNANTHSSQQLLPKCAFRDETEEAVYYLVTKYLENKECPW